MKPEYVTDEMEVAFRQNVITTNRGSLIGLKAAIAAAINAMPQSGAQAQIDALKAERDALRDAVAMQAADDGLWFHAVSAPEAYLQQELKKLHQLIGAAPVQEPT